MKITEKKYCVGEREFTEIILRNKAGMVLTLSTCGAGIRDIFVPDRDGVSRLVTLRPADETEMVAASHGKTIGRTAGRIAGGEFTIDGRTAVLQKNNFGVDNLHGGKPGLRTRTFDYAIKENADGAAVEFAYLSPDGENGYFGNVKVTVVYTVYDNRNEFDISYIGTTDVKTLLNLTNHVYLNLSGDLRSDVGEHELFINASQVGKIGERKLTVGEQPVSPAFDFRTPRAVDKYLGSAEVPNGYDHPFFIDGRGLEHKCAAVYSPMSGIALDMYTDYPCVVLYTNNDAKPERELFGGKHDFKYGSVCLECQYHPDGVHLCPDDCGIFSPDKPYRNEIKFCFSAK